MVKVSIARTENNLYSALVRAIDDIGVLLITPGDHVLIKPNLVEPAAPDSGQITNPRTIEAVARYCLDCGAARVIWGRTKLLPATVISQELFHPNWCQRSG